MVSELGMANYGPERPFQSVAAEVEVPAGRTPTRVKGKGRPSPVMDVLLAMKVGDCQEATCSPRTVQNCAYRLRARFDCGWRFRAQWCRPGWARFWRIE